MPSPNRDEVRMTAKADLMARLDRAVPELRTHAVKELWLFGSAAREELNT